MLDISPKTVEVHARSAADKLPGTGRPQYRLMLWSWGHQTVTDPE